MFVRGEWGSGVAPALYLIVFGKILFVEVGLSFHR